MEYNKEFLLSDFSELNRKVEAATTFYQKLCDYLEKQRDCTMEAKLTCSLCRGKWQYYLMDKNQKKTYLSSKKVREAEKTARNEYYQKLYVVTNQQLKALKKFQSAFHPDSIYAAYTNLHPGKKVLTPPLLLTDEEYATLWQARARKHKVSDEHGLTTDRGETVRSKSECLIANKLYRMNIPYHYEEEIVLKNKNSIYPDFKVLNRRTRKEYLWEHFGKADNEDYMEDNLRRLSDLGKCGYLPGDNLILTMEGKNTALDPKQIDRIIESMLL